MCILRPPSHVNYTRENPLIIHLDNTTAFWSSNISFHHLNIVYNILLCLQLYDPIVDIGIKHSLLSQRSVLITSIFLLAPQTIRREYTVRRVKGRICCRVTTTRSRLLPGTNMRLARSVNNRPTELNLAPG